MSKLKEFATGATIELVDGKVLEINGPAQKVDYLINVMQRMLVVFGPATKNYVTITVGGAQLSHHLASLKQMVGANGRVVATEKIHFSVCKTDGEWSAVQVGRLAKDIAAILTQAPQSIRNTFVCDDVAFFNQSGIQIQGIHYAHVCLFVSLQLSKCWFSTWCVPLGSNQPHPRVDRNAAGSIDAKRWAYHGDDNARHHHQPKEKVASEPCHHPRTSDLKQPRLDGPHFNPKGSGK
ncbi:predicted protein [Lichtheimia corymbifera JMRC:FSU:9682]|uniref:Uncharacterized protein n=1 Tax=Lichtheimia corymbifera JMRC:FSU:9682 TaxID=1263082 RepID=A0A068SEN2_9FUNG|nr:predicted protein [Lichtheimia corymbifera JMRC:FSU:9682]